MWTISLVTLLSVIISINLFLTCLRLHFLVDHVGHCQTGRVVDAQLTTHVQESSYVHDVFAPSVVEAKTSVQGGFEALRMCNFLAR